MKNKINQMLFELNPKNSFGDEPIIKLGLRVPLVRAQLKEDLSFLGDSRLEILKFWDLI